VDTLIPRERFNMITQTIQRQYNEVVASHYDLDPQAVIGRSLDRAIEQLRKHHLLGKAAKQLKVLDVGMGTGLFFAKLRALGIGQVQPYGLDLAEKMVETARRRIADLVAEVGDAAHLDVNFPGQSFDLVCTHFITGFVPMQVLLPKIWDRLEEGGYWSLVGGTRAGFPALQARANSLVIRLLGRAGSKKIGDVLMNPANQDEVVRTLEANGFEVREVETFEPALKFANFDEFMEFAYRGGWFTPIIEGLGLHKAKPSTRWMLNRIYFPVKDHHSIVIALARKVRK
jgi:SAM-dependent methyltransferase